MTATARSDTLALWQHLYGTGTGYVGIFSCQRDGKKTTDPREQYFAWPDAAPFAIGQLEQHAHNGRGTYFCAHLLTDKKRDKPHAAPLLSLYADGDAATIPDGFPEPTATVESSPGRHHYYWRLTAPCEPERAERLNKRIAKAIGADGSGYDLSQLLRPPGFPNQKYDGAVTRLVALRDAAWDVAQLERIVPELPAKPEPTEPTHTPRTGSQWTDELILARCYGGNFGREFAALWRGDMSAHEENQSAADYALCRHLFYASGGDIDAVDRLFRQSGLMRDKWDSKRGDSTYGAQTISKAAAHVSTVWEPEARLILHPLTGTPSAQSPTIITADALLTTVFPEPRIVIDGVLLEGSTILAGRPKLGKSWLCLGMAFAVAAGGVALGSVEVTAGDVLYLALEDGQRRLQKRLRAMLADDKPPARLHLATKWRRSDDGGLLDLDTWLTDHPETRLVIIDTLKRFRPASNGKRQLYDVDYEAVAPLTELAQLRRVAIVVVHHTRKSDAEDPLDLISGSTGLTGAVDGAMVLKRERGTADAVLSVTHRDMDDQALGLVWDQRITGWRLAGNAIDLRRSAERQAILDLLNKATGPLKPIEISRMLGRDPNATRYLLHRMLHDNEVAWNNGSYSLSVITTNTPNGANSANTANGANGLEDEPLRVDQKPLAVDQSANGAANGFRGDIPHVDAENRETVSGVSGVSGDALTGNEKDVA